MKKISEFTLIVVRHAHRNKTLGGADDDGLSVKGKAQVKKLLEHFKKKFGKPSARFFSSPKKRCIQTIEPLARHCKSELEILPCLDESSTNAGLQRKLDEFTQILASLYLNEPLIVISSHGDWIPAFLEHVTDARIDLDKGGWVVLEKEGDHLSLRELIQEL